MKKPWYLNKWIWIVVAVVSLLVPYAINEAYQCKSENVYITEWGAADVLSFYGSFLSFAGSVVLGLVAVEQSRKANHLSERMLDIEERQEVPVIDIQEMKEEHVPSEKSAYHKALQIQVRNQVFYFNDDNTLGEDSDTDVVVFSIKNISSSYITSMQLDGIEAKTTFYNGKSIVSSLYGISYNGGVRVLGDGETLYLIIGGIDFEKPPVETHEEIFDQEYTNPMIEMELSFLLGNIRGKKYRETIQLRYSYLPVESRINYPWVLGKEIVCIEEVKE